MKLLREGVLALSLVATAPCHAQQSDRLIAEQAHRRLESLAPYGASGAVVITHDGAVIYRGGFGMADRATRRSMTPDLGVDIASMTKTLTAVAIARLIHQGVLNDTDGLKAWFPEAPADKAEITLGQLMLHRSGLPQFFIDGGDFQTLSRDEALSRIMSAELRFAPGTDEQYSDAGMTLLAILIERVTGQPFEDYLDTTLFRPMGLTDTSSYGTAATRAR